MTVVACLLCFVSYQMEELVNKPTYSIPGESAYEPAHVVIEGGPSHVVIDGTEKSVGIPVHVETLPAPDPYKFDPKENEPPY